jgi:hypothetical protein
MEDGVRRRSVELPKRNSTRRRLTRERLKAGKLLAVKRGVLGERHERAGKPAIANARDRSQKGHGAMVGDAHPAHARIDVRLHGNGLPGRPEPREPRRVVVGIHGQRYAAPHQFGQHRIVRARHQEYWLPHPLLPQLEGFVGANDSEALDVGIRLE